MTDAHQVVEATIHRSHGRLIAYLAAGSRDLPGAEDALNDAVERALLSWPSTGIPANPEAWLLTTARRKMIDRHRHRAVAERAEPALRRLAEEASDRAVATLPDKRLELLFVCAHPAIDPTVRSPLMLQTVLGVDAARIASAFLTKPATMGQRLVRAKRKILDAGISFRVPEPDELGERLGAVLDAIYGAFGTGWEGDIAGSPIGLANEAIELAGVVVDLMPDEPEASGLLALMLYSHSRRDARRDDSGAFVPLSEQDTTRWDRAMIARANTLLASSGITTIDSPYLLEAMIQGTHANRITTGPTDWHTIVRYYDALLTLAPTIGAQVSAAAAVLEARGPAAALRRLDAIDHPRLADYQPWWTVRAHALIRLGHADAEAAVQRAAGLSNDPAIRAYLLGLLSPPNSDVR